MDSENLGNNEKQDDLVDTKDKIKEDLSQSVETEENLEEDIKEKGFFSSFGNWMLIIGTFVMTGVLIVVIVAGVKLYKSNFKESSSTTLNTNVEIEQEDKVISSEELTDKLDYVHSMVNTVIVAKDGLKFGKRDITKENIETALGYFTGIDSVIVEHLEKWKSGDFSSSVEFHNYIWKKLDGTIGEASDLLNEEIEKVKSVLGF